MDNEVFNEAINEALRDVFGQIDRQHLTHSIAFGGRGAAAAIGGAATAVLTPGPVGAVAVVSIPFNWLVNGGLWILKKISGAEKQEKIELEKKIQEEVENNKRQLLESLHKLEPDIYSESVGKDLEDIKVIVRQHSIQKADAILASNDIRKRLCPALKSATDDVFDISKSISPVLVGCIASGTVSIPLNPVLFAAIAVVCARMGIAALCAGYISK